MDRCKVGGNDSTEVHLGEIINHKSMDGLVMSNEICGGIHLLREDLSLALVIAPAFKGSQSFIPYCRFGNAAMFLF